MKNTDSPILRQHCFRRRNYGDRAEEPIDDLLVVLDLISPHPKDEKSVTRKVMFDKMRATIVFKKKGKLGEQKFIFHITHEVLGTLRELKLIRWRYRDIFKGNEIAKRREALLEELLSLHDAMQVGQTLRLRKGIYQHFKGEDRLYRVLDVRKDDSDGVIKVKYQQLYGEEYGKTHKRPLSMFTEVIHRDEYVGPRWQLVTPDEPGIFSESMSERPTLSIVRN